MRAGHVDVPCLIPHLALAELAGGELQVELGSCGVLEGAWEVGDPDVLVEHTGVIDQCIESSKSRLYLGDCPMDGFVVLDVDLDRGEFVVGRGKLLSGGADGCVCFFKRSAAHEDFVCLVGAIQGSDDLIANAGVGSCDQSNCG